MFTQASIAYQNSRERMMREREQRKTWRKTKATTTTKTNFYYLNFITQKKKERKRKRKEHNEHTNYETRTLRWDQMKQSNVAVFCCNLLAHIKNKNETKSRKT